jgi:LysR family glycine cleavage system transcriptional activator
VNKIRPVVGLPTLSWLRAFESAARTSSFAAAAAELNLTAGAIGYQIRALEAHLGFALFERLPRGVKLTPMGVAYLPSVRNAFEEIADSTLGLFGGTERVKVTVHAPVSLTALWLAPQLPAFMAANPGIDIRMSSLVWDNAAPDESTDLEIRYGTGNWHGYRSEHLLKQGIVVVCSPGLLQAAHRHGDVATFVSRHLVSIIGYEKHWLRVRRGLQIEDPATNSGPTVDTTIAALELAANGAGCALTHRVFLAAYFASGRLVRAVDREFADDSSFFVCTPQRRQRTRRQVQLFRDWLIAISSTQA